MKKTITAIVLAAVTTIACCAAKPNDYLNKFDPVWDNSKCFARSISVDGKDMYRTTSTTFPLKTHNNRTYYVVNKHSTPPLGSEYSTCDGSERFRLDALDSDSDTALISKPGIEKKVFVPRAEPTLGELVYIIGYPYGEGKLLNDGMIASEKIDLEKADVIQGEGWWVTNDVEPGMSGSPAYVFRNNRPHIIGYLVGGYKGGNHSYVIDIDEADSLFLQSVLVKEKIDLEGMILNEQKR